MNRQKSLKMTFPLTFIGEKRIALNKNIKSGYALLIFTLFFSPVSFVHAESVTLTGTVRDFSHTHPDFQTGTYSAYSLDPSNIYSIIGLVQPAIGLDRKPQFNSINGVLKGTGPLNGNSHQGMTSAASFAQWFNDEPSVNQSKPFNLTLEKSGALYSYDSDVTPLGNTGTAYDGFFPIDEQMGGNQGNIHNYHFTFEMHSKFTYQGGETFTFIGDDDVWVYVNDELVIDIGGRHSPVEESVSLDTLGLIAGQTYDFDFFFVERAQTGSNMKIVTSIELEGLPETPKDLSCPADYQLEKWPASAPNATTFDSNNGLLRLTASENFTNTTHAGIGGIHTGTSGGEDSEIITITSIDPSVTDIQRMRILSYDLDSETSSDRDYSYVTFNTINADATSVGNKVEPHALIPNAYIAKWGSGGATGADTDYHAGYVVDGISDGSAITLTSGYSGAGTVSFVGYQACVKTAGNVSGKVYQDINTNDVFDGSDAGIYNISVWSQLVNVDGTVDPVKVFANSDASGNYQITGLADGNYQVHVDIADTQIPSDHAFGGTLNPSLINISSNSATDVDFPFDEVVCNALTGEVSEIGIPLAGQLKTTDKLFVPSKDAAASTGHLRAYTIDAGGNAATTATWDAATVMTSTDRDNNLYSSDGGDSKKSFESIGDIDEAIRDYIIDAPLGSISRGNDLDLLTQKMDISLYLSNTEYRKHYKDHISTRDQLVLSTSDDGFLYAFNYDTGALVWAWMPRSLQSELTASDSYQNQHLMAGSVDILDLPDDSGNYDTYVVGAYKNGLGHYVLKLKDDGTLDKIIWDEDQSSIFTESPNNGEMEFFKDINGYVYAAYALSNTAAANTSVLKIRSLTENTIDMSVNLNYQATSTPFVMFDFDKRNAPSKSTLYLGNQTGSIHNAVMLNSTGLIKSAATIQSELQGSSVTAMDDSSSDAVLYIDASVSSNDNRYYLSSQSESRLSIHRYHSSDQTWHKAWTSYVSGAGSWDSSDNYTDDNSGVPTDNGGFAIVPPTTGIQSLPVTARITAKATIVGDRVVLPLTVLDTVTSTCYGKAYYYLYRLSDGNFPVQSFIKKDGTEIVENIALGYGEASQLAITDLAGTDKLMGYGVADQSVTNESGIATSFIIRDPVTTGVRGWKEIGR